jgi:hypothetical protein
MYPSLALNQSQEINFVMVDVAYTEVAGLGGTFTLELRKPGGAFVGSAGIKAEISNGWYRYVTTAAECDTRGPLAVKVTGAGCIQQNLLFEVETFNAGCTPFTYTVTNSVTLLPIPGVEVWITTDIAGVNVIWHGWTDAFGVARDGDGNLPCLDAGTVHFWKHHVGMTDDDNPDTELIP